MIELRPLQEKDIEEARRTPLDIKIGAYPERDLGPLCFSGFVDGSLLGMGGIKILWPGVAEAWIVLLKKIQDMPLTVRAEAILTIQNMMKQLIEDNKLWRLQAMVRPDFPKAIQLVEKLGFEREGLLRQIAPDRSSMYMYARLI